MDKYKHGKKTETQSFQDIIRQVDQAKLSAGDEAYFWLLYYCGVRKSEGYERVTEDFRITDTHLIVDFHQRKKHGATVDPLEFPRSFPGIDKLILAIEKATSRNQTTKSIFTYEDHKRVKQYRKAHWVFPEIQSTKAWSIIRKVLGVGFYPHFLRLNRLSEISGDPTANLLRLKSFSGIKSTNVLDSYLGTSKKEQQKAMDYIGTKISSQQD